MLTHSQLAKIVAKVERRMARQTAPKKAPGFKTWLARFVEEKAFDLEQIFTVPGRSGDNFIPLGCVVEAMNSAPAHEQEAIRRNFVFLDFKNADCLGYFRHLAQALAI